MKFLSCLRNMCVFLYIWLYINFSIYYIYITYICIVFILYIVYVIYLGGFEYCISAQASEEDPPASKDIIRDSSSSVQSKQSWEFNRHKDDMDNSTIR